MEYFKSSHFYDTILFETENFIVMPSIGAFVEGYLLIVPKIPKLNYSLYENSLLSEANKLIITLKDKLSNIYGDDFIVFEHGPSEIGKSTGCGINTAHLHFVPLSNPILNLPPLLEFRWKSINCLESLSKEINPSLDYLFFQDQDQNTYIAQEIEFPSQTFRRAIAACIDIKGMYNWRIHPFEQRIKKTIETIGVHV